MKKNTLTRRRLLKSATGAALALPFLESFHLSAQEQKERRCLVAINMPLGLFANGLFPDDLNSSSMNTEYLASFAHFHPKMSLISGLYHPGVANGHVSTSRIFAGTPNLTVPDPKLAPHTESFDQTAARYLGDQTRFASLALQTRDGTAHSWHQNGMAVVSHNRMDRVFDMLFGSENASNLEKSARRLSKKESVLDTVLEQAGILKPTLSQTDRDKLEEFFHAVRQTEISVEKEAKWLDMPKPQVDPSARPGDRTEDGFISTVRNALDLSYLALTTDSTRIITLPIVAQGQVDLPGVNNGYHALSHHGLDPKNIAELKIIETAILAEILRFVEQLSKVTEADGTSLLDRTTILLTSNLGNASNHSSQNLPLVLIGGGYKHGRHFTFRPANETPLSNVYLTILQSMGVPVESFSTSTGIVKQLI